VAVHKRRGVLLPLCGCEQGNIGDGVDVLARLHSECLTGDIFGSLRCDCGPQLHMCLERLEGGAGRVRVPEGPRGEGIGLGHKLQAYNLQVRADARAPRLPLWCCCG